MKMYKTFAMMAVFVSVLVTGCKSTTDPEIDPNAGVNQGDTGTTPLGGDAGDLSMDPLNDPNSPLSKRIIYFDYNSSQIRADSVDIVAAHGQYMSGNSSLRVRLEGHADERGSREYNLALGERRALSIKRLLLLQGVSDNQVEVITYGEELPAAYGHDEASWQQNRRVEIAYPG